MILMKTKVGNVITAPLVFQEAAIILKPNANLPKFKIFNSARLYQSCMFFVEHFRLVRVKFVNSNQADIAQSSPRVASGL